MAEITVQMFSLCPFRSPVEIPEESKIFRPQGGSTPEKPPRAALGPCLYLGCGLWCVTRLENGKPVDGMCALKVAAGAINSIANALSEAKIAARPISIVPPTDPTPSA